MIFSLMLLDAPGQKFSFNLFLSLNHYAYHEIAGDSVPADNPMRNSDSVASTVITSPEPVQIPESIQPEKKYRWFDPGSLFGKKRSPDRNSDKSSRTYPLFLKYMSPFRLFLHISALK